MTIEILSAGPMLSIQDHGRLGRKRFGVPPAGAMDRPSMDLANALCGNDAGAAALEFAGLCGRFRAGRALRLAVTGGDCDIKIGGRSLTVGQSHKVQAGEEIQIGALKGANWGYVAISGGIDVPAILGARATHLRFALGGLDGRVLAAGDELPLGEDDDPDAQCLRLAKPAAAGSGDPIRIVLGPQDDRFDQATVDSLTSEAFRVTKQRDRMGMVLEGPELAATDGHDIVSDGTVPGAIQVPASGQPIVLMADAQTTGGYPKIATVISTDLPRLAQMPTGTELRFAAVDRDSAEEIALAERQRLHEELSGLVAAGPGALSTSFLLSCDLVGGIATPDEVIGRDDPSKDGTSKDGTT